MNPNIGKDFFMDNINFESASQSTTKSIGEVEPLKIFGNDFRNVVKVESAEFDEFINELYRNSIGISRASSRKPITYDICLTCWEYMTSYYIIKHEAVGHKGIKGAFVNSKQNFLALAEEYGRLSDDKKEVTLFKPYERSRRNEILPGVFEDSFQPNLELPLKTANDSNIKNIFEISRPQILVQPDIFDIKLKKREIKELEMNELEPRNMLQEIRNLQNELVSFKNNVDIKLDLIIQYLSIEKQVKTEPTSTNCVLNNIIKQPTSNCNFNYDKQKLSQKVEHGMPFNIIFKGENKESNKENNVNTKPKPFIIEKIVSDLNDIIVSNPEANVQSDRSFDIAKKLFL